MDAKDFNSYLEILGWTKSYFAELMGLHRNTVSSWSVGKVTVPKSIEMFLRLAVGIKFNIMNHLEIPKKHK